VRVGISKNIPRKMNPLPLCSMISGFCNVSLTTSSTFSGNVVLNMANCVCFGTLDKISLSSNV
jgi:hypothetical protein